MLGFNLHTQIRGGIEGWTYLYEHEHGKSRLPDAFHGHHTITADTGNPGGRCGSDAAFLATFGVLVTHNPAKYFVIQLKRW